MTDRKEIDYEKVKVEHKAIDMVRPFYTHKNDVYPKDLTVLICQGNKRFLTQLCIESLLRFYPDIKILVVNGSPNDFDSTNYLDYVSLKDNFMEVWEWEHINSHGVMMDTAIRKRITTKYILLMDNDTIVERGGFIEPMIDQLQDPDMFATGTLMVVTKKNDSIGVPETEEDILRHAHPSCSIIKREMYADFRPATDHGAPLCYTMADADRYKKAIGSFPINEYVSHLSGASWVVPKTIWSNDHNVFMRPFVTFIITDFGQVEMLYAQHDKSFDILPMGNMINDQVVIHDQEPVNIANHLYDLRYRVMGEYVCVLPYDITGITFNFVTELRKAIVHLGIPDRVDVGGLMNVKREVWQQNECLNSGL